MLGFAAQDDFANDEPSDEPEGFPDELEPLNVTRDEGPRGDAKKKKKKVGDLWAAHPFGPFKGVLIMLMFGLSLCWCLCYIYIYINIMIFEWMSIFFIFFR